MKLLKSNLNGLKAIFFIGALLIFNESWLSAQTNLEPSNVKIIKGFTNPESVATDEKAERFFVSNIGAKHAPTAKDGDGFISKLDKNGKIVDFKFLPLPENQLNAPKGLGDYGQPTFRHRY